MTNVEALISVERGAQPTGVEVFYESDPNIPRQRAWLVLSALMALLAGITALRMDGSENAFYEVGLVGLFAFFAFLMSVPSREPEQEAAVRRILVISERGLITRDPWGLQNFDFDEIRRVSRCWVAGAPQLCVEDRKGQAHLIDHSAFDGADRISALIQERVAYRVQGVPATI